MKFLRIFPSLTLWWNYLGEMGKLLQSSSPPMEYMFDESDSDSPVETEDGFV